MKKIILILGILFVLLLAAMAALPFIFGDEIKQVVKNATNENLNAKVEFEDVNISLFKRFPNLAISVEDLTVTNNEPFEGDTVVSAKNIGVSVDLFSLISGDELKINSIFLESPKIFMYVLEDGRANYNISKEDVTATADTINVKTETSFKINLQSYSITNGKIAFIDQTSELLVGINNINHEGKGDFTQDDLILDTKTTIDEFTVEKGGIKFLNKVKANLDMQLAINVPNMKFVFKENKLMINNLLLEFDGSVAMPSDEIDIDLKFSSPRSEFKDIISLIPAIYKNDFSELKSSGTMDLTGAVVGKMSDDQLPSFNISLNVNNGSFQYPDLPTPINNVNLKLEVANKDGKPDNTIVNMSKIHLELGEEPIDGKLYLTHPNSGPLVETQIQGKIDLAKIKDALDLKDISKLEGIIVSDFALKGNMSTVSKNYENVDAKGKISVSKIKYEGSSFSQIIEVSSGELNFTPKNIELKNFSSKIGESDINANGSLKNLIPFVFSDGTLSGTLALTSNFFDFNPYMTNEEVSSNDNTSSEKEISAFDIPENINFNLKSNFKKLLYDNLELTNVTGEITVKDSKINLSNLNMNLLNGSLSGSGYYEKSALSENPNIQFNLNVNDFGIKETFDKFVTVKQFVPMAKYINGSFSTSLKLNSKLDNTLTPIWDSFFSNGILNLKTAEIRDFKPFTTVGSMLKMDALSNPKLQNVKPKYEIKNGRFYLSPMEYKIGNYNVVLSGSNGIDQTLDYVMEIDVPAGELKNKANSAVSSLIGKDLNLIKSNTVKVNAAIGGTIDNPKIKTSAADVAGGVVEQVTDTIVEEAKSQVDSLKVEAENKVKAEIKKKEEEAKKKLEEEAKKKLKKLFKFG